MEYVCLTNDLVSLENDLNEYDCVIDCKSLVYEKTMFIAIIAQNIYSKSQKEDFVVQIKNLVKEKYNVSDVVVTFDVDLFYKAKNCESDLDILKLINIAKTRQR